MIAHLRPDRPTARRCERSLKPACLACWPRGNLPQRSSRASSTSVRDGWCAPSPATARNRHGAAAARGRPTTLTGPSEDPCRAGRPAALLPDRLVPGASPPSRGDDGACNHTEPASARFAISEDVPTLRGYRRIVIDCEPSRCDLARTTMRENSNRPRLLPRSRPSSSSNDIAATGIDPAPRPTSAGHLAGDDRPFAPQREAGPSRGGATSAERSGDDRLSSICVLVRANPHDGARI